MRDQNHKCIDLCKFDKYKKFRYNEPISVKAITQSVSDLALNFGEGDMTTKRKPISRPYGVVLLIAGVDDDGPNLYQVEPSGTMVGYQARIIGPADERQSFLAEKYDEVCYYEISS